MGRSKQKGKRRGKRIEERRRNSTSAIGFAPERRKTHSNVLAIRGMLPPLNVAKNTICSHHSRT